MFERKYVVFRLGGESFGLPIERVERILPQQAVTRMPRSPKMLLGVFDLRGETVAALDLRQRMDFEPADLPSSDFVVVQTTSGRCALKVDRVDGIFVFEPDQVERDPSWAQGSLIDGVARHGDRLVLMVNADEVVPTQIRRKVAAANAELALAA